MKQLPIRLHHLFGMLLLFGVALILAGQFLSVKAMLPVGIAMLGGAAFGLTMADVRQMLTTRRGFGRLSGHLTEVDNPMSFKLHIALLLILACLWGIVCVFGFREIISQ